MQTLACHQIKYAGEITGVQQLGDHQLMQIAVLSGVQQVSENQVGSTCVTSVACDPYWNNVVLAMHMDTDFSDVKGHTTYVNGSTVPTISATESMFGGYSGYFPGVFLSDITTEVSTDFELTGNFTIEYFVNTDQSASSDTHTHISYHENLDSLFASQLNLTISSPGTGTLYFGSLSYYMSDTSGWKHIAATRDSGTDRLFIDGILVASSASSSFNSGSAMMFSIGAARSNGFGAGWSKAYIDDLRITKGVARYTSDFTPPTAPFAEVAC